MKRVLLLAVVAVMLCTVPAMAVNSVVINDQTVGVGATGVEIPVFITNDVALAGIVCPFVFRDVNPGGFPTQLTLGYGDRLPAGFPNPLFEITLNNQYSTYDGDTLGSCQGGTGGFFAIVETGLVPHVVDNNPWGVLFVRNKIFSSPSLAIGADVTGSLLLTVDVGAADGTFEIDTTCTDPANHLQFVNASTFQPLVPVFTKGTITVGNGGGPTNTPPTAICQDVTVDADANCEASVAAAQVDNGSFDTEDAQGDLTFELVPAGPYQLGDTPVQMIVTDTQGEADTCDATITVEDNTPPTVTCEVDADTISVDESCTAFLPGYFNIDIQDNCSTNFSTSQSPPQGFPLELGTHTVWTIVDDGNGNKDSCSFTVLVVDDTNPEITVCPGDVSVQCEADVPAPNIGLVTATDNCGNVTITHEGDSPLSPDACGGTITRTYRATDDAGNFVECTQTITVDDTEKPVIADCPGNIQVQEDSQGAGAVVNFTAPTATDNCDASVAISQIEGDPSGSTFSVGIHPISFEAMDDCGNADTCSFTVEVTEGTPTVVAVCQDITVDADGNCQGTATAGDVDNGSSGYTTLRLEPTGPYELGDTPVMLIAANDLGDADTCTATITVEDNTPPSLTCPGEIHANNSQDNCYVVYDLASINFLESDNCSAVTLEYSVTAPGLSQFQAPVGCTDIWVYATDEAGNTDSCLFTLCVDDVQKPTIACPVNIDVFEDVQGGGTANVTYSVATSDNCPGEVLNQLEGLASGSDFPLGTTTNTFEVIDNAGNADTCSFTVKVNSLSDELVARCTDVTVSADDIFNRSVGCSADVTPEQVDNGSTGQDISLALVPPGPYPLGETQVMLVVTEPTGAADTCDALITVEDNSPPVIECNHDNDTVAADENCEYAMPILTENGFFFADDNCSGSSLLFSQNPTAGTLLGLGDHTVYIIAEDEVGNKDSCSFVITVEDQTPPQIQCSGLYGVGNDPGQCGAIVSLDGRANATDNCNGNVTITYDPPSGFFNIDTTSVMAIATDDAGNADTCYFDVVVYDTEAPSITCPGDISVDVACGETGVTVNFKIDASDNCPGGTLVCTPEPGSFFPVGTTDVNCTVTDAAGNQNSCSFKVSVYELSDPDLVVTPDTLFFTLLPDEVGTDSQKVYVENAGCGAELRWYLNNAIPWANAWPTDGFTDSCFYVGADATGLAPGEYWGKIYVNADVAPPARSTESYQFQDSVCVKLVVEDICDQSRVQVDPDSISVYYNPCDIDTKGNPGQYCEWIHIRSDLSGCIDGWTAYWDDSTFIESLVPDYGETPDSALLCLDLEGLEPGEYYECIQFYRTILATGSKILADDELCIRVVVEGDCCDPILGLDSTYYEFYATVGEPAPANQQLGIFNASLDCQQEFKWTLTNLKPWLSYSDTSGMTPSSLSLIVDHSGLGSGCYWDTVTVTAPAAIGSPGIVLVKLCVADAPIEPVAEIWVGETCGQAGDTVAVPVNFCNNFDVSGISSGLMYDASRLHLVYGDFAGSRVEGINGSLLISEGGLGEICISAVVFDTNYVDSGCGLLATLYFLIDDTVSCDQSVIIDSTTIVPTRSEDFSGCGNLLTDRNLEPVWPSFSAGSICVECPDECQICGTLKEVTGAPIPGATVELKTYGNGGVCDTFPAGATGFDIDSIRCVDSLAVIATTTTDANGDWCFSGLDNGTAYFVHVDVPGFCDYFSGALDCCSGAQCEPVDIVLEECPVDCQICGYTYTGATVEVWSSYPDGQILDFATADTNGHFCFDLPIADGYQLRVLLDGYCPAIVDVECGDELKIGLESLPTIPVQPFGADWYSQSATIEGTPIVPGDVIIAMDPDGVICGVTTVETDGTYLIHVIGDDPTTPGVDEGAEEGDAITFYYNCDCPLDVPQTWTAFASNQFDAAFDCSRRTIEIPLCESWTLISFNVLPSSPLVEDVLNSIDGEYRFLYSATCADGNISWANDRPEALNDLTAMDPCHGYWVLPTGPNVGPIVIEGAPVDVDKDLNLCTGWNAISYLPEEWDERSHALASVDGYYDYLFTAECDGIQSWAEGRPINDLDCMKPTKGYWIHMTDAATQNYPTSGYSCPEQVSNLSKAVNVTTRVTVTNRFSDFWSAADMTETGLRPGDLITAKTSSGMIVGEALVNNQGWFLLHAYGDDKLTDYVDGANAGEELTFEVNGMAASVSGNTRWAEQESNELTVFAAGANPLPTDYALLQNYPNPFNPSTTIQFRLPEASEVNLAIYNVLGQQVRSLVAGMKEAGTHTVEWDGRDDNGSTVQSGMYFYRIQTPSFMEAKKMTLLK